MNKNITFIILITLILTCFHSNIFCQKIDTNSYYHTIGLDKKSVTKIENLLKENGIEQNNINIAKKSILEIINKIPEDTSYFNLDKTYREHLIRDLGIKPSQIEVLKKIALRISKRNKKLKE